MDELFPTIAPRDKTQYYYIPEDEKRIQHQKIWFIKKISNLSTFFCLIVMIYTLGGSVKRKLFTPVKIRNIIKRHSARYQRR